MNLEKLVAVSGLSGIYKMAANRPNGLLIEDLKTGKRQFASTRQHQFSPLESISIYTDNNDSTPLKDVFQSMLDKIDSNPPVANNASPEQVKAYFAEILPTYDRDRVYIGDMKKAVKWFSFLHEAGITTKPDPTPAEVETEEVKA